MSPARRRPLNSLFEEDLQVRAESTDSNRLKNVEITGRWRSGQSQQTVNLPPNGLRRFEPSPPHQPSNATRVAKVGRRMVKVGGAGFPSCVCLAAALSRGGGGRERTNFERERQARWAGCTARRLALSERRESKGG